MDTLVVQNLAALPIFLTTLPSLVNELFTRFIPLSQLIQAKNKQPILAGACNGNSPRDSNPSAFL